MSFLDFLKNGRERLKKENKGEDVCNRIDIKNVDISNLTSLEVSLLLKGDEVIKSKNKELIISKLKTLISILYERVDNRCHKSLNDILYYVINFDKLLGVIVNIGAFWEYELVYDKSNELKYHNIKLKCDNKTIMEVKVTMTMHGRLLDFECLYSYLMKSEYIEIKCPIDRDPTYLITDYDVDILNKFDRSSGNLEDRIISQKKGTFFNESNKKRN